MKYATPYKSRGKTKVMFITKKRAKIGLKAGLDIYKTTSRGLKKVKSIR